MADMPDETLNIKTDGWQEIPCDKCGSVCSYDPTYNGGCFGCFIKANPEGAPPQ